MKESTVFRSNAWNEKYFIRSLDIHNNHNIPHIFFHNVYPNGVNLGQTRKRWNAATNDHTPQYLRIQLRHLVTAAIRFVFYPALMTIY